MVSTLDRCYLLPAVPAEPDFFNTAFASPTVSVIVTMRSNPVVCKVRTMLGRLQQTTTSPPSSTRAPDSGYEGAEAGRTYEGHAVHVDNQTPFRR